MVRSLNVVVTRAAGDNNTLRRLLETEGHSVSEVPLIEVQPPIDGGASLREAVAQIDSFHWIVFTSANGVRAFAAAVDRLGCRVPEQTQFAVVGPATASALQELGFEASLQPAHATGAALGEAFAAAGEVGEAVMLPVAELAGSELAAVLIDKGYAVEQTVAYRTTIPPATEAELEDMKQAIEQSDVVVFYSPSAVDRLCTRFGPIAVPVLCIGPSTAQRAVDQQLEVGGGGEPSYRPRHGHIGLGFSI